MITVDKIGPEFSSPVLKTEEAEMMTEEIPFTPKEPSHSYSLASSEETRSKQRILPRIGLSSLSTSNNIKRYTHHCES